MSRVKVTKKSANKTKIKRKEWPLTVYIGFATGLVLGYTIGRIALDAYPHLYHLLSGLVGGVIGFLLGWVWYRWRGDVL